MTQSKEWKRSELRMAELLSLGGRLHSERIPVSGRQTDAHADIDHQWFAVQHKYGKRATNVTQRDAWRQAAETSERTGLPPLVTLEQRYGPGRPLEQFVMMRADLFTEILKLLKAGTAW